MPASQGAASANSLASMDDSDDETPEDTAFTTVEVIEDMQVDVNGSLVNKLLCLSGLADGQSPDFSGCTTSTASRLAFLRLVCFEAAQRPAPDAVLCRRTLSHVTIKYPDVSITNSY